MQEEKSSLTFIPAIFVVIALIVIAIVVMFLTSSPKKNTTVSTPLVTQIPKETPSENIIKEETTPSPVEELTAEIPLTITEPKSSITVKTSQVMVKGTTSPKAEVFVNDITTVADNNGNFSAKVTLEEGENTIVVITNNDKGQNSEKEIIVTYDSGQY